jgi:hypothetical protein
MFGFLEKKSGCRLVSNLKPSAPTAKPGHDGILHDLPLSWPSTRDHDTGKIEEPAGFIRYAALASIVLNSPFPKVVFSSLSQNSTFQLCDLTGAFTLMTPADDVNR